MKNLVRAVAMLIAAFSFSTQANAQASVDIDVDITLSSFAILYCFNDIDVTVTGATLARLAETSLGAGAATENAVAVTATQAVAGTFNAGDIDATMDIANNLPATSSDLSSVNLNLNNVCAVRGLLSAAEDVDVTVANTGGPLVGPTSNITVNGITATPATIGSLTLGTPTTIDVVMDLDMSAVDQTGTFNGPADVVTVTATIV